MTNQKAFLTLGVGFGFLAAATLGVQTPSEVVDPPQQVVTHQAPQTGGGGGYYGAGRALVKQGHTWVALTKSPNLTLRTANADAAVSVSAGFIPTSLKLSQTEIRTHSGNAVEFCATSLSLTTTEPDFDVKAEAAGDTEHLRLASNQPRIEWLSMDEVLMLLETIDG